MITVTTLGTGTIALNAHRVRAGHFIQAGEARLLLDCGSGVTQRLAERGIAWMAITHVAITHFHIDHFGDLPTLIFAWKHGDLPARTAPVEIIGPVGTRDLMARLAVAYGEWVTDPGFPLAIRELAPGESAGIAPDVVISCSKVPHSDESMAYSVESDGARVVYSGDTGYDESFADWAHGCDLLLCECSLPAEMAIPQHLTPESVGAIAQRAQPALLAITHLYPPVERVDVLALVRERFDGSVVITSDGWTWSSGPGQPSAT